MRLGVALCALVSLGLGEVARADSLRGSVRFEAGGEYDTNPNRTERVSGAASSLPIEGSPLGRLVLSGDFSVPVADRLALAFMGSLAGKTFARESARGEDVVVADTTGAVNVAVAARTSLSFGGSYYDVFQRGRTDARDFRSVTPSLRIERGVGENGALSAGAGYRWFTYKPDGNLDFAGPTAVVLYRGYRAADITAGGGADWEWSGGASAEFRSFAGIRCVSEIVCPGSPAAGLRRDQFWILHAEFARTGAILLGGGAAMHANASNSYGETLARGLAHVRTAILLPHSLSLSARAEVVFTRYRDSVPIARDNRNTGISFVSIEDESRSTARVEVVRPWGTHFEVGARYTVYASGISTGPVHYLRQTALLFVAVTGER